MRHSPVATRTCQLPDALGSDHVREHTPARLPTWWCPWRVASTGEMLDVVSVL
jgi:hypothetical protein